ncbi:peptidoglycan-binding domain-containing protein [Streptomyces palmae]|uniref:peptidoglycan-binding domain-containing protein n=1 Tax=Streptomyces palmae TaxID=1701085 RepID=UPI001FD82DA5|nr:peptidoglycan-binding domain-containing protein [Streptomyces palmae]
MTGQHVLDAQEDQAPPVGRRRRRVAKITVTVFVLATAGAVTVAALGLGGDEGDGGAAASQLPPSTAKVLRQTLRDTQSEDGVLGYGPVRTLSGRLPGTLTKVPAAGARISRGQELYAVDNQPVVLMYGPLPAYRTLRKGAEGPDVKQLEANLAALGYTGFTVDEEYSDRTAKAVEQWQEDLELKRTGTVELGRLAFAPGPVRIDSTEADTGDQAAPGQKVLAYTGTAKAVTVELDSADRQVARKGRTVGIRLPDGTRVDGTVSSVTSFRKPAEQGKDARTRLKVVISPADAKARRAVAAYDQAGVHVDFTAGERENVLTVPVASLLALAEGGYGVEVVGGSGTRYVPVHTGLFAGGRVEISGAGITEGTTVGMPK